MNSDQVPGEGSWKGAGVCKMWVFCSACGTGPTLPPFPTGWYPAAAWDGLVLNVRTIAVGGIQSCSKGVFRTMLFNPPGTQNK